MKALLLWLTTLALASSASAVECSSVEFSGKSFTICRVDVRKEHLQLFLRDGNRQLFNRFDRLARWAEAQGQNLVFAMNAGMYHSDFSSVGLFVADGKQEAPLNMDSGAGNFFLKPNGVFAVTESGARVIESSEYAAIRERVVLATQSGPLLVRSGKLHPAFNASSESRLRRNGVGVASPDLVIFAISESPVTFYELATLFRDKLGCPDALYLDGTVSSLYAPELTRDDFRTDLGPMIAVTESTPTRNLP
jgi:uncharacterized protein YigE (DUF2233 family)